ncbi:pyridoxamine 5'-phosphate oxidase family protein [Streptomyces sp. NPDC047002]|uniref:pyridoxamine 5'-phosphate oxidase family protein n=1 Tax=Streptomyces sp. NPDC047002 TaxID=3155475 RepID=UPI00345136CA
MSTDAPLTAEATALLARVPYGKLAATLRALPFVAPARHVVLPDALLLRMHRGLGYHRACAGTVVAYGADDLAPRPGDSDRWSVQCIGTASIVRPPQAEEALFGEAGGVVDGEPFDPVYLRLVPELTTVHHLLPGHGTGAPAAPTASTARPDRHAASSTI